MSYYHEIEKLNQQQKELKNELEQITKEFHQKLKPITRQKLQLAMRAFVQEYGHHFIEHGEKLPFYFQLSFTGVYDDEGGTDKVIESISLYDKHECDIDLYFPFSHVDKKYGDTYEYEDMEQALMEHLDEWVDDADTLERHIGHEKTFQI